MSSRSLIAIDWGSTSFRAYLLDHDGKIRDSLSSPMGILNVPEQKFEEVLEGLIGHWQKTYSKPDMIASGMIGSRQGWKETPYLSTEVGLTDLAGALEKISLKQGSSFWIVPGMMVTDAHGIPDVMRGEETQVLGWTAEDKEVFVLPGTHSKWVLCEQGRIVGFSTFMTGELYQILKKYSILGKLINGELEHPVSFIKGVRNSQLNQYSGLLHNLFSTRTLALDHQIKSEHLAAYLSGLLIGSEIREAKIYMEQHGIAGLGELKLIGSPELGPLYKTAIETLGDWQCLLFNENSVVQGLYKIAVQSRMFQ
ncbi:MAG: 2-dehydro-3-deoxygalactonokinase [SAR324 cluster bacterium]|nr:2-dehydro-3-deoxygalactonokinase [SAR324 cluster bacterium]